MKVGALRRRFRIVSGSTLVGAGRRNQVSPESGCFRDLSSTPLELCDSRCKVGGLGLVFLHCA